MNAGWRAAVAVQLSLVFFGLAAAAIAQGRSANITTESRDVGIDQRLGNQVPRDLKFRDETGETVTIGSYFGKEPVILSLVYFGCTMMCTLTQHGLVDALRDVQFNLGEQYRVLTVSFDPRDRPDVAMSQKNPYAGLYGRPGASQGWHFLVGDGPTIQALAQAVGFRFKYLPDIDEFVHPTGIVLLTPEGKVSRYFFGIQYPAPGVRQALLDASEGKIGNAGDMALMLQKGNSSTGRCAPGGGPGKTPNPANHQPAPISAGAEGKP
jgi:protein SCO1/2